MSFADLTMMILRALSRVSCVPGLKPIFEGGSAANSLDGTASRVVALAKDAGVALTPAGASFPPGNDPRDRNIRLAPTFPEPADVAQAMEAVTTCVLLAAAEKLAADA